MASRSPAVPPEVLALRTKVATWRRSRRHQREPMPRTLVAEAVALANRLPVALVARGAGIQRKSLSTYLRRAEARPPRKTPAPRVVKLAPLVVAPAPRREMAVEIEGPSGYRLRVVGDVDVAAAVRAFVEGRR